MKTVFVVARRIARPGGMENAINLAMKNWGDEKDPPILVVSSKTDRRAAWLDGLNYIRLWFQAYLIGYPFLILHLFWTLRRLNPDIVVAADYKAVGYCALYRDLFAKKMKVACWIHSYFDPQKTRRFSRLKNADLYLSISRGLAKTFERLGVLPEKIHVVYNPSETAPLLPRPSVATFVYVGRIAREKRVCDFILALSRLKGEWRATIAGGGQDAERIRALAGQAGVTNKITWLGWQDKPWEKIKEATCLILPSDKEVFNMALLEAMQRGVPCICAHFEPAAESLSQGVNGWFYPCRDVEKLSYLMQSAIDNPDTLPDSAAVKESVRQYSTAAVVENMKKICLKYINN